MIHPEYNKKAFLLPDSINSCAVFHAKIMPDGNYRFRISDCLGAIRLHGDLNDETQIFEAVEKLNVLANAASEFAKFIEKNYSNN